MLPQSVGPVLAIALRSPRTGPMREVREARAAVGGGLEGDVPSSAHRGVTFLSARQWKTLTAELGVDLPWHTRRANVLVDADSLAHLTGRVVQVGTVRVAIKAETKPCGLMDELRPGLRAALTPDCRAGVYGQVIQAGALAIGDAVTIVDSQGGDS